MSVNIFKSTEGLEEYEKDDIESGLHVILNATLQYRAKIAKGRATNKEADTIHQNLSHLMDIATAWAERPLPTEITSKYEISDNARIVTRRLIELITVDEKAIIQSPKFCVELENLVSELAALLVVVKMDSVHSDGGDDIEEPESQHDQNQEATNSK